MATRVSTPRSLPVHTAQQQFDESYDHTLDWPKLALPTVCANNYWGADTLWKLAEEIEKEDAARLLVKLGCKTDC